MTARSLQSSPFSLPISEDWHVRRLSNSLLFSTFPTVGAPAPNYKDSLSKGEVSPVPYCYGNCSIKAAYFNETTRIKAKIYSVKWTSNGERLVAATRDDVLITNPYTLTTECIINGPASGVLPHPTNPDVLAVLSYDKPAAIKLFDLRSPATGVASRNVKGTSGAVPSGSRCKDKKSDDCVEIRTQAGLIISATWRPDGKVIVFSDRSDVISSLDISYPSGVISSSCAGVKKLNASSSIEGVIGEKACRYEKEIGMVCFDNYGELLFVTREDGMLDAYPGNPLSFNAEDKISLQVHHGYVSSVACDPTGRLLATGGTDQTVNIIDVDAFAPINSITKIDGSISSLSFSHSGEWLSWGTKDVPLGGPISTGSYGQGIPIGAHWSVSIAGMNPCEVYKSFNQTSPIVSVSWHPYRDILAFACEGAGSSSSVPPSNEYFMNPCNEGWQSGGTGFWSSNARHPRQHPIGILTIE